MSDRFTVKKGYDAENGRLTCIRGVYIEKRYKTVHGCHFAYAGHQYSLDLVGIEGAIKRVLCEREPTIAGLHDELVANQFANVTLINPAIDRYLKFYKTHRGNYGLGDPTELIRVWAYTPHAKMKERVRGFKQYMYYGDRVSHKNIKEVEYKGKPDEFLAANKYLRGTGDLTVLSSLVGGFMMDMIKDCLSYYYSPAPRHRMRFVKTPQKSELQEVFDNLLEDSGLSEFYYFSDDSCIKIKCTDGYVRGNLDITACDGSNYSPIFNILRNLMEVQNYEWEMILKAVFDQCKLPFFVRHPVTRKKVGKFKCNDMVLYSGSTLTTMINNIANSVIYLRIVERCFRNGEPIFSKTEIGDAIKDAAKEMGFLVRLDVCEIPEDLQFLKHSPHNGVPIINAGVWFKGFGTCQGDIPLPRKVGSLNYRSYLFCCEVVEGRQNWGNTPIRDAFNRAYPKSKVKVRYSEDTKTIGDDERRVGLESLCRRYRCSEAMLSNLLDSIDHGVEIRHPVLDIIMAKDYGM